MNLPDNFVEYVFLGGFGGVVLSVGYGGLRDLAAGAFRRGQSEQAREAVDAENENKTANTAALLNETSIAALKPLTDRLIEVQKEADGLRASLRAVQGQADALGNDLQAMRAELDEYRRRYGPLRPTA